MSVCGCVGVCMCVSGMIGAPFSTLLQLQSSNEDWCVVKVTIRAEYVVEFHSLHLNSQDHTIYSNKYNLWPRKKIFATTGNQVIQSVLCIRPALTISAKRLQCGRN